MSDGARPTLYLIAGPNGSGKSTMTARLLAHTSVPIVDPDAIARTIRPSAPQEVAIEAGREALRRQEQYLAQDQSFAVETTLSGQGTLRLMEQARQRGFIVQRIFICLDTVETNIGRIAERVAHGGHNVPDEDVRRRYDRSLLNLMPAIERADWVIVLDNTTDVGPIEVLTIVDGAIVTQAHDLPRWVHTALGSILRQDRGNP